VKYSVYDNGRPANFDLFPSLKCGQNPAAWHTNSFDTFDEAHTYAQMWLSGEKLRGHILIPNVRYDYNGYGDWIEIREE